jgi:uncharacterized phage-like protein YoqJ
VIIAATGHRPERLGGHSDALDVKLRRFAVAELRSLKICPTETVSGMALGWDMAFAEASLMLGIPLTAAIAFRGQDKLWPPHQRIRFRSILQRAQNVIYVSEPPFSAWKMMRRNVWMVDNCEHLLALWDKSDIDSGTKNCLDYARAVQRPYENLWDRWKCFV